MGGMVFVYALTGLVFALTGRYVCCDDIIKLRACGAACCIKNMMAVVTARRSARTSSGLDGCGDTNCLCAVLATAGARAKRKAQNCSSRGGVTTVGDGPALVAPSSWLLMHIGRSVKETSAIPIVHVHVCAMKQIAKTPTMEPANDTKERIWYLGYVSVCVATHYRAGRGCVAAWPETSRSRAAAGAPRKRGTLHQLGAPSRTSRPQTALSPTTYNNLMVSN